MSFATGLESQWVSSSEISEVNRGELQKMKIEIWMEIYVCMVT